LFTVCNFGRKVLGQTGDGHFAPIGGYEESSGKTLLLDTARFKYPPFWVDTNILFDSINTHDKDADKNRGFILMSRKTHRAENLKEAKL
jgi:glutathione gamma-glutamylcysteinyltransferase